MAAMFQRFARTGDDHPADLPPINYAYHIDAGRYDSYIKLLGELRASEKVR